MNPTPFEIGIAVVMVAVILALLAWFMKDREAGSERRMIRMLARAGVDPDVAARGDNHAIIKDIRGRCLRCSAEGLCERWLAGKVDGENAFCPNAPIFAALKDNRAWSEASSLGPEAA